MNKVSRERFEWLKQKYYEMWDWLSRHPDKAKSDWPGFEDIKEPIENHNFACQFLVELANLNNWPAHCEYCPLGRENIGCLDGLHRDWKHRIIYLSEVTPPVELYDIHITQTKRARQIRDLEWSDEYVEGVEKE